MVGWITDAQGTMLYMNAAYLKGYGFTAADFGKSIYDLFPESIATEYYKNNMRVLQEGNALETIEHAVLANGKKQILKICKFPLRIEGVGMVAGWAVDISEEVTLQEALSKSVERYQYVNEATSDAFYDWEISENKLYTGSSFKTLFGHKEDGVSLKKHVSRIHPDDLEEYKRTVFSALRNTKANRWSVEYRMRDARGRYRNVVDKAFIIKEGDRAVRVTGAIRDITEKMRLEQKLLEQEWRAKWEVVKSIIETQEKERRKLSVELHDNVNQILASCKLMLEYARENKENAQMLTDKGYQSLQVVIEELRRISHDLNPSVIEDIGLVEAISQMADKINVTGKPRVQFHHRVYPTLALNEGDKIAIYRVIQEQIANILKHAKAQNVSITLRIREKKVDLAIEDDGIGFDRVRLKKAWGSGTLGTEHNIIKVVWRWLQHRVKDAESISPYICPADQ